MRPNRRSNDRRLTALAPPHSPCHPPIAFENPGYRPAREPYGRLTLTSGDGPTIISGNTHGSPLPVSSTHIRHVQTEIKQATKGHSFSCFLGFSLTVCPVESGPYVHLLHAPSVACPEIVLNPANFFPALKSPHIGTGLSGVTTSSPYLKRIIKLDINVRVHTTRVPVTIRSMVWASGRWVIRAERRQQSHLEKWLTTGEWTIMVRGDQERLARCPRGTDIYN